MARRQSTFSVELRAQSFFNICRGHALLFQVTLATTFAVVSQTGTRRNQPANHNVFFQATQKSRLPVTAPSVRTRVVSWNEAAEMNDSVASDALVMPSSRRSNLAGSLSA